MKIFGGFVDASLWICLFYDGWSFAHVASEGFAIYCECEFGALVLGLIHGGCLPRVFLAWDLGPANNFSMVSSVVYLLAEGLCARYFVSFWLRALTWSAAPWHFCALGTLLAEGVLASGLNLAESPFAVLCLWHFVSRRCFGFGP